MASSGVKVLFLAQSRVPNFSLYKSSNKLDRFWRLEIRVFSFLAEEFNPVRGRLDHQHDLIDAAVYLVECMRNISFLAQMNTSEVFASLSLF